MICRAARPRRRGAVLVIAALVLVAMIGMMALTLDGGSLMAERRRAQMAADAAATAAACDLMSRYGLNSGLDTQGAAAEAGRQQAASQYGSTEPAPTVTVNIPPQLKTSRFFEKAGYAEAVVTYNQPRSFASIFASGAIPVSARAVARGQWGPQPPVAFLATEPALPAALTVALSGRLAVVNGSANINSSSFLSFALALNARVSAPTFNFAGTGISLLSGMSGTVNFGVDPMPDPLAYLGPPDPSTLPNRGFNLLTLALGSTTLQPGVYKGGIRIAGFAKVTLQPGIYYMQGGGFTVADTASLTGTGVTIVNAPILPTDAITIAGTGSVTLTPPTTGLYAGVTIMQPPALIPLPLSINPMMTIGANSLLSSSPFSISGTVYAPLSTMTFAGNNQAKVGSQVICRSAIVAANASVQINWDSTTARTPLPVRLVE